MELQYKLKMEFNGTEFSMHLSESEVETLKKETNYMNEILQEEGEEPDWTIYSSLRSALWEGIKSFESSKKEKQAADADAPDSHE